MESRFLINRREAKIMGVAAGMSDYTGVDPLLVRLGFVAAAGFFLADMNFIALAFHAHPPLCGVGTIIIRLAATGG